MIERRLDRILGDLVEHDATHGNFRLEHLRQMPADGFAFTVGVGSQQNLRRILDAVFRCATCFFLSLGTT